MLAGNLSERSTKIDSFAEHPYAAEGSAELVHRHPGLREKTGSKPGRLRRDTKMHFHPGMLEQDDMSEQVCMTNRDTRNQWVLDAN